MLYSARYKAFLTDKQGFFSVGNHSSDRVKALAKDKSFSFLANNRLLIEEEFNQMFASLKRQGRSRKEFWLYCYYCCTMLESYYESYDKQDKAADYRSLGLKLKQCCDTGKFPTNQVESLQKKIATDLGSLASTPMHTSKTRDWLGFTNIYRIHFVFCRLSIKQSLLALRELKWLEKLDQLLGRRTDVDGMVSMINSPAAVFNALSVGIFAARFIINAGLLLKHTFSTSAAEMSLSKTERFYQELYARHAVMANDLVWGVVNLFSNYAAFFHISAPVAGWLTAGFMIFDVSLLIWRRAIAEQDYLLKKEQYKYEITNYNTQRQALSNAHADDDKHCKMLEEQLIQLEISWHATSAAYLFNVAAAVLLMAGFSISMLLATPAAIVACYFVCTIAVAMYLTADIYGKYKEKSLVLELMVLDEYDRAKALLDMQSARNDFIIAMAKTIIMPLFIVTTFAVCWQAALLLAAVYVGYEATRGYFKEESMEKETLPLHDPEIIVEEKNLNIDVMDTFSGNRLAS